MPKVAVLPPELASQIAAGEIAERPASVIKELVENALDAGATRCDVAIEGGGIRSIVVSDDGSGMAEEDARLSLERHATSKLRRVEDLMQVASYGFRGEALPSIASVSRFRMCSRTRDADAGVEVRVEGGSEPVLRAIGVAPGTRIEVKDLFFNVPARRKFLRSSATEAGHVSEVVENAALARPDVTFSLERDGRTVREFLRVSGRDERVQQVQGELELAVCRGERGPLTVEAYLSRPEAARVGAGGLRVFVNGRPVRDRAVMGSVAHAYGSVLERGRYPRGVVYLELPFELVDVNVHPQKSEVRFADARAVTEALHGLLARELASAFSRPKLQAQGAQVARREADLDPPAPPFARDGEPPLSIEELPRGHHVPARVAPASDAPPYTPPPREKAYGMRDSLALPLGLGASSALRDPASLARDLGSSLAPAGGGPETTRQSALWASLTFVAQLRQTYLLCEGQEGIYLLDQHAAAERVTFTKLRRGYQARQSPSQALLFPIVAEVTAEEAEFVERRGSELAATGFDVRVRGGEAVSIHAVPKLLARAEPERLLRDFLSEVVSKSERAFSDAVDLALATMACHGSVRAGDPLAEAEATALLRALDEADFAGHCPHGRPIVTFIGWAELERKVGRR